MDWPVAPQEPTTGRVTMAIPSLALEMYPPAGLPVAQKLPSAPVVAVTTVPLVSVMVMVELAGPVPE
jgi:hypothetical protein